MQSLWMKLAVSLVVVFALFTLVAVSNAQEATPVPAAPQGCPMMSGMSGEMGMMHGMGMAHGMGMMHGMEMMHGMMMHGMSGEMGMMPGMMGHQDMSGMSGMSDSELAACAAQRHDAIQGLRDAMHAVMTGDCSLADTATE